MPVDPDQTMPDGRAARPDPAVTAAGPAAAAGLAAAPSRRAHKLPARIGPYHVLDLLGEGGMGQVLKAEQLQPVRRVVALKVIKLGMDSREVIARFQAERQALALMDHPGVAKVFDAGVTERGQPFFAMELVTGVPLTQYCDEHRLTTRQRLGLFAQVCHAVQHAHQKGIIHRDLKPGNILVGEVDGKPVPKVIDFGIAKATGDAAGAGELVTRDGVMIGTLAYMSPEQAAGSQDIDTRADVYSLGVVLYELLTGELPLDPAALRSAGLDGAVRLIRESEPARPSTRIEMTATAAVPSGPDTTRRWRADPRALHRELSGDLDWITLKAMEKDRSRRYETANGLAADVHRHLNDEPVSARPPTLSYRLGKLARRHKAAVVSAAAVAVALVVGMTGTTYGFLRARAERDKAVAAHAAEVRERDRAERAERDRKLELVDELISASPEAVPPIVAALRSQPDLVMPPLRAKFEDPAAPQQQRLRAACALAACALAACEKARPGDAQAAQAAWAAKPPEDVLRFLVEQVLVAPAPESENVIAALRSSGPSALEALMALESRQVTPEVMRRIPNLARYAFTLLSLGNPAGVDLLMKGRADDTGRTAAIHTFASWHGDLAPAAAYVGRPDAPADSRSGLCAALGTLDPASLGTDERRAVEAALAEVYRTAPDSGSHGAAGWALRRWGLPLPYVPRTAGPVPGRDWYINGAGMTMLRLPNYLFTPAEPVTPPPPSGKSYTLGIQPFFICDCETSMAVFEQFTGDASVPAGERPADWPGPDRAVGPTDDCPVQRVDLHDAIGFCNWLSRREGRKPCYLPRAGQWHLDPAADGYRLPSGAEWECACRTGTTTPFPFGDDTRYLMDYVVIGEVRDLPCGSKQPNAWGLFDMLGNAWEMTWQNWTGAPPTLRDLAGGDQPIGANLVMRGGSYDGGTAYTRPGELFPEPVNRRAASVGFRVVFTAPPSKGAATRPAAAPGPAPAGP